MTTALLHRGADPYALSRRPIHTFEGPGLFPEEPAFEEFDLEQLEFPMIEWFTTELLCKELELNDPRQQGKRIPAIWFNVLQDKSLNPMTKDKNGRTAFDITHENSEWMW